MSVPPQVFDVRHRACVTCQAKCVGYLTGVLDLRKPSSSCPHPNGPRWVAFAPFGLGTVFAVAAQPIAKGLDTVLKTNVQSCGGCKQRKESWNKAVPDVLHPWRR